MRATWRGYIQIGQLGIPVRLYNATSPQDLKLVSLHAVDGSPVERPLYCKQEQRRIAREDVVKAVEYEPGQYVTLTAGELERAAEGPLKSIRVNQFCDETAVPPSYYEKPYYVVPGRGGERAYALLREVFVRKHAAAMTTFIIHGKEHIGLLRMDGDLLMLHQLRFAKEVLPRSAISTPPLSRPSPSEIEALSALVDRYGGPLFMEDFHDEYTENLQALVERKAKGLPAPRRQRSEAKATPVGDIETVLRDTLAAEQPVLTSGSS